eukprot:CFRG0343T1
MDGQSEHDGEKRPLLGASSFNGLMHSTVDLENGMSAMDSVLNGDRRSSLISSIQYYSAPSLSEEKLMATDINYSDESSHVYRRVLTHSLSGVNDSSLQDLKYDASSRIAFRKTSEICENKAHNSQDHQPCLLLKATNGHRVLLEKCYDMNRAHPTHKHCIQRERMRIDKENTSLIMSPLPSMSTTTQNKGESGNSADSNEILGTVLNMPIYTENDVANWKIDINSITRKLMDTDTPSFKALPHRVRTFYNGQNELIQGFIEAEEKFGSRKRSGVSKAVETMEQNNGTATHMSNITNVILTVAKIFLSYMTGSMSIVSSLVDSVVDLFTGLALWLASHHVSNHNPYKYPIGREQLEPIAVVVSAVVMVSASMQVIWESLKRLYENDISIDLSGTAWVIMGLTVVSKACLYCYCRNIATPTGQALAQDHYNDVISNGGAILFAVLASKIWLPLDPVGAILIAIYIMYSWMKTGYEEIQGLSGLAATPETLKILTYIAYNHHPDIIAVETVSAYHFGTKMIAEVDIVLCPFTPLPIAHDIAETLQMKYESWGNIERAFVHIDFEIVHERCMEHQRHL